MSLEHYLRQSVKGHKPVPEIGPELQYEEFVLNTVQENIAELIKEFYYSQGGSEGSSRGLYSVNERTFAVIYTPNQGKALVKVIELEL